MCFRGAVCFLVLGYASSMRPEQTVELRTDGKVARQKKSGPQAVKACSWTEHSGKYSGGYAAGMSTVFSSASQAQQKCIELGMSACKAVTCHCTTLLPRQCTCTVRGSTSLRSSRSGETTFVPSAECDTVSSVSEAIPDVTEAFSKEADVSEATSKVADVSKATLKAWDQVPTIDICHLEAEFASKVTEVKDDPDFVTTMREKGYQINQGPGEVNVVGVRVIEPMAEFKNLSDVFSNTFRDTMRIFWRSCDDSGTWVVYTTQMTTLPGTGTKGLQGHDETSVMAAGQYVNAYCKGTHGGNAAMRQASAVKQMLADSKGKISDTTPSRKAHSLNFHGTRSRGTTYESTNVNNWSLGCQVTSGAKFFNEVLALIFSSVSKHPHDAGSMSECKYQDGGVRRTDCHSCMTYTLLEAD